MRSVRTWNSSDCRCLPRPNFSSTSLPAWVYFGSAHAKVRLPSWVKKPIEQRGLLGREAYLSNCCGEFRVNRAPFTCPHYRKLHPNVNKLEHCKLQAVRTLGCRTSSPAKCKRQAHASISPIQLHKIKERSKSAHMWHRLAPRPSTVAPIQYTAPRFHMCAYSH